METVLVAIRLLMALTAAKRVLATPLLYTRCVAPVEEPKKLLENVLPVTSSSKKEAVLLYIPKNGPFVEAMEEQPLKRLFCTCIAAKVLDVTPELFIKWVSPLVADELLLLKVLL